MLGNKHMTKIVALKIINIHFVVYTIKISMIIVFIYEIGDKSLDRKSITYE